MGPDSTVPTVGASGAIAGVLGGYIVLYPRARVLTLILIVFIPIFLRLPAMIVLGLWFVEQLLFGYFDVNSGGEAGGVAYFAHIGGFVFGLLAIRAFAGAQRPPPAPPRPAYPGYARAVVMRTLVLGIALVFIALLAFLTLFVLFSSGPDVLVVTSLGVLALFAFGIIGALGNR